MNEVTTRKLWLFVAAAWLDTWGLLTKKNPPLQRQSSQLKHFLLVHDGKLILKAGKGNNMRELHWEEKRTNTKEMWTDSGRWGLWSQTCQKAKGYKQVVSGAIIWADTFISCATHWILNVQSASSLTKCFTVCLRFNVALKMLKYTRSTPTVYILYSTTLSKILLFNSIFYSIYILDVLCISLTGLMSLETSIWS